MQVHGYQYAPDVFAILLQFLASTAGIALLVALSRGIFALFADRGPRRRVLAIKTAHETAEALDSDNARLLRELRDRELAALAKAMARNAVWRSRWLRILTPIRKNSRTIVVLGSSAAAAALTAALALPSLLGGDSHTPGSMGDTQWSSILAVGSSLLASATVLVLHRATSRVELAAQRNAERSAQLLIVVEHFKTQDEADPPAGDEQSRD